MCKNTVLWLGYGDLAKRTISLLNSKDFAFNAVSRSKKPVASNARHVAANISDIRALDKLISEAPKQIVLTITPSGRRESDYKTAYFDSVKLLVERLRHHKHKPESIIFVSSTSVYHQHRGEMVHEQSPTLPSTLTARVLLDTEALLQDSGFTICNLRFSGIYGPGRFHLLKQVAAGVVGDHRLTNRIHAEDCARVLAHLIVRVSSAKTIPDYLLASDMEPVSSAEVRAWLAEQMGLASSHLKPMANSARLMANKSCDNSLLLSLGFKFKYPSYKQGFVGIIEEYMQSQVLQPA